MAGGHRLIFGCPHNTGPSTVVPHVVTFRAAGDTTTELTVTEHGYPSQQLVDLSRAGMEQVNPNHASHAFARLATSVGLTAHPHMLRHALASAMAANKEPASIWSNLPTRRIPQEEDE